MNRNHYHPDERMHGGIGRERELERLRNQQFQGQYSQARRWQDLESGSAGGGYLGYGAMERLWESPSPVGHASYGQLAAGPSQVHHGWSERYGSYLDQPGQYDPRGLSGHEDFRGRGPKGYTRSDERIREDICERLTRHPDIDASDIEIEVRQGVITLTGSVDHRPVKHLVEDLVENVSGVQDIENRITVKAQSQLSQSQPSQSGGIGRSDQAFGTSSATQPGQMESRPRH